MITCRKCKEINGAEVTHCQKCSSDLLPGLSLLNRIMFLVICIVFAGLMGLFLKGMLEDPERAAYATQCLCAHPIVLMFAIVVLPLYGLYEVVRKRPVYLKYEDRANRHMKIDPEQSLADLAEAIKFAPKKKQGALLKKRSNFLMTLGREEEALRDKLAYLDSEIDDTAFSPVHAAGQAIKIPIYASAGDAERSNREIERKILAKSGKLKAVGFCKKCQKAVGLTNKFRCPDHPRKKPMAVKYVLPADLDKTLVEVEQTGSKEFRKNRVLTILFLLFIAFAIAFCIVVPLIQGNFP